MGIKSALLLIPLLALSAMGIKELSQYEIPNLRNHPDLTSTINAVREMQNGIDVLRKGLGMDLSELTIQSSDTSLQEKILADLKTMYKRLNILKTSMHIPLKHSENLMATERNALSKKGMTGIVLEIFLFYRVSVIDLDYATGMMETLNTLTESIERNDLERVRRMITAMPENDVSNKIILENMMDFNSASEEEFINAEALIESGPCYFKHMGYSILLQNINKKKMMLSTQIVKFILSLREAIDFCQYSIKDIEEFKQNIPRSLQILVLDNTDNICIRNTKYQEELILDIYKYNRVNPRYAFTWVPKTRRDENLWELDFDSEFKMRIKHKKYGEYLTTSKTVQSLRAFGTKGSDGFDWVIELSENWDEIYLKNLLTNKYIYVTSQTFCPRRRHVQTSHVIVQDGGKWEFLDCGDQNPVTPRAE